METCCDSRMRDNAAVTIRAVAMGTQLANTFIFMTSFLRVSEAALRILWLLSLDDKGTIGCKGIYFLAFKNGRLPFSFFAFDIFC